MTQVSSGSPWTSCGACGWSGGPYSYLVIERWVIKPVWPQLPGDPDALSRVPGSGAAAMMLVT
jgi:hypothetical protein